MQKRLGPSRWAASKETVYLAAGGALQVRHFSKSGNELSGAAEIGAPEPAAQFILLTPGATLILTRAQTPGQPTLCDACRSGSRSVSLAEVQEEILWICEAAHVPVIWATQVLENLAKKGVPSRAEITDAAMGERAECVMLNKGPHLVEAVCVLDDILQRMEAHQSKKSARLRPLRLSALS